MLPILLMLLGLCTLSSTEVGAAPGPATAGRWKSSDHVTMTNPAKAGAKFFLDVTLSSDGTFRGSWDQYVCFNYPGAYGTSIISCQRAGKSAAASGRLDVSTGSGQIELDGLGATSFKFELTSTQLDLALPREWLKQGDAVLYETTLRPK